MSFIECTIEKIILLELRVLRLAIQTLSELWDTVNSQLQEKNSEFWDKVTIILYSLYSMAEISFHRFHKWEKNKQHKNAQSNTHSHSSPLPLLPFSDPTIPLPLPGIFFSLSDSVLFCISKTIQRGHFYSMLLM